MRNQLVTQGIVLTRTDFQEADRILTILTPDQGKLRVIAKGVRRPRSKLAGGIELLSVSDITVLPGRGEMGTLISSRLITYYSHIVEDISRTMLAYDFLKTINRVTEDAADKEYFMLLRNTLAGLNEKLPSELVELWFTIQLLKITGHTPNLKTDAAGNKLEVNKTYLFDFDNMAFTPHDDAPFTANHIKLSRLAYATQEPQALKQVKNAEKELTETLKLAQNLLKQHIRV